jgi:putative ABC transport system permease protein
MSWLFRDVRYALRQLRKSPGFAAVAIVTLALGIGANTAIFSVVHGVLLRPLPFHDPDRLVRVWHVPPPKSFPGMTWFSVSAANYVDWEKENHVFASMAIYTYHGFTFTGTDKPEQVDACAATSGFFSTLGVQPALGRSFTAEEDQPGHSNVVVLSHRLWQEHFGSNPGIVGRNINLDGQSYLVAGVMPATFQFPDFAQMWTPMAWTDKEKAVRGEHHSVVIARLKPGVDLKQAQAEMNTISDRLAQLYPADDKGWGATVIPLQQDLIRDVRPALLVLLGAVAFVLLIACVNVANLALAKTFSRQKEIAIRTALGASWPRILRQMLAETVLLAIAGGALGLFCAHFGVLLIVAFLADKLPHSVDVGLDAQVLVFTAIISVASGVIAGVLPALRLSRGDVNEVLKQGMGRAGADSGGTRTRSVLVVAEVALSLILLVGAGLMIRSFQKLQAVNPGFDSHQVLTMIAMVSRAKFPQPAQQIHFFERVLQQVRPLPGVESAGVIDDIPLDNEGSHQPIAIEGRPIVPMSEQPEVDVRLISPGYLGALRIPVLRGRDLNDQDIAGRPPVILISESMARQFWPGEDAIGKRLTLTFFPDAIREVVGVVGDVKLDGLDQTRPSATLYFPLDQISASANGGWTSFPMTLVVRSRIDSAGGAPAIANVVHSVDPEMPLRDISTMDEFVANSLNPQRFNMLLLGAFAGLALLLAAVGIYSVLSYSVKRSVREIGIRIALGAQLRDVLRTVVIEGMKPTLIGIGIGVAGALALGRVLASLVFEVTPTDPVTFLEVTMLLVAIALLASLIPAYRATKVDPLVALRYE